MGCLHGGPFATDLMVCETNTLTNIKLIKNPTHTEEELMYFKIQFFNISIS